ncbi:hypothetical protein ABW21_db0209428 [Orbilia brochopaga]|nr:hypothetical protein ABW21_db0209428 [Drechslerella brochopaga]
MHAIRVKACQRFTEMTNCTTQLLGGRISIARLNWWVSGSPLTAVGWGRGVFAACLPHITVVRGKCEGRCGRRLTETPQTVSWPQLRFCWFFLHTTFILEKHHYTPLWAPLLPLTSASYQSRDDTALSVHFIPTNGGKTHTRQDTVRLLNRRQHDRSILVSRGLGPLSLLSRSLAALGS